MSWIRTIEEGDAPEPLGRLYERICNPQTGQVDNVLKVHGLHPDGLEAHWKLYRASMRGTKGLRTAEREMIALVVSAKNGCHYWITHHRRGLLRLIGDESMVRAIIDDFEKADLDARRMAMLRYATKLTTDPGRMDRGDVDALRQVGFEDPDILAIAEVVAYYAYANRIADGLGIKLE